MSTYFSTRQNIIPILKITFFIILTIIFPRLSFGQITPSGLQKEKVQKEIIQKTASFDSLVFIDFASYWGDDQKIKGFGFVNGKIYRVTISFKNDRTDKDSSTFYNIKIYRIVKCRLLSKSKINSIKGSEYWKALSFSNDSLNYIFQTNGVIRGPASDGIHWTLIIIKDNRLFLNQSDTPEYYRKIYPTQERRKFIEIVEQLQSLLD